MQTVKMLLDTDIGGDIDDALALALALNSPEIELLAVTTVNTDPALRARIAAKMLRAWGRDDIPVAPGQCDMFDGSPTYDKDINQAVVLTPDDPRPTGDGVRLIIDTIRSHPGEVVLTPIGPLTNIAVAFDRAPDLAEKVQRLVMMAGTLHTERQVEYNILCDPAAAAYVMDLPVEKTMVPLDVTLRCRYRQERHAGLQEAGAGSTQLIWELIRAWQKGRDTVEPTLHDPLAVAVTFAPDLVRLEPMNLKLATADEDGHVKGECVEVEGEPHVQVAVDVDVDRFETFFAERLMAGPQPEVI